MHTRETRPAVHTCARKGEKRHQKGTNSRPACPAMELEALVTPCFDFVDAMDAPKAFNSEGPPLERRADDEGKGDQGESGGHEGDQKSVGQDEGDCNHNRNSPFPCDPPGSGHIG